MTDSPLPKHFRDDPNRAGGPELLRVWEAHGLLCVLALNPLMGIYIGYVRAPDVRPDDAEDVDVHGGVTYGQDPNGWVGWDAGHFMDHMPFMADHGLPQRDTHHWTQAEAETETESMAAALAAIGVRR